MRRVLFLLLLSCTLPAQIPHNVLICGVCKDVAARVPYSMHIMEKIGALFADYRIIVYENNSSDATPQIIKEWQQKNNRVEAISEHIPHADLEKMMVNRRTDNSFYPAEAIARARNVVLDRALSDEYAAFSYVIWMDMDFKLEPNYDGFVEAFETDQPWDAVFAYGIDPPGKFWDWYAFRDYRCPLGSELLGTAWWYLPKQLQLTVHDEWYPVYSAFGGAAVYKKEALKGCRYSAVVTSELACLSAKIIQENPTHPIVQRYRDDLSRIKQTVRIEQPSAQLPAIADQHIGIVTPRLPKGIIWRMSSFVYNYPSVCEHATLHAAMIMHGHDKLFINPRLIFRYGG